MRISAMGFFVKDAFRSLKRNKTISIAAAATVAATLFIFGISMLTMLNIKQGILEIQSKVEAKVYLEDNITMSQKRDIEDKIKNIDGVVNLSYETKSEALNKFKKQLGDQNKSLVEGLDKDNPIPSSYIVKVSSPEIISKVVSNIKGMPGIYSIQDGRGIVDKIVTITRTIKWAGSIIFVLLIGVSLFLIGNTIKITVYSRRKEIGIMKYIGATDWFIRWPFIIEGIIIGVIGAIVSNLVLYYLYRIVYAKASSAFIMMQLISPHYVATTVFGLFILAGVIIGAAGSVMSIRKFLNV
ncbi:permease-like cell division protein FtsX [Clostridium sp. MT-14]|uniref:Cell division protein FtsX n=1 Tax=Clostridium aromativorans TaxID=2836848 RepID=A0ABS8N984_9CLOT|nr:MULTISPECIES: permease-like cell division protein FtsX [Clostridium]KAA8674552.1 ABC transporter permease [Clostridium sp. HV4-5-A1G]MCC9296377.1 permease-like cell division protein FtsX [Clostridium aromativorans]